MNFLYKFLYQILMALAVYFSGKKALSYLTNLIKKNERAEFKSQANAETMKNMMEAKRKANETDEIINNATAKQRDSLM